jgi:hypothetical protein
MPDDLTLRIKALDEASPTLRDLREGLEEVAEAAPDASAGLDNVAHAAEQTVAPAVEAVNIKTRDMTQLLQGVGLGGVANMLQLGDAAIGVVGPMTGAAGATGGLTFAVGGLTTALSALWASLWPVLLILGAAALTLVPFVGAFMIAKTVIGASPTSSPPSRTWGRRFGKHWALLLHVGLWRPSPQRRPLQLKPSTKSAPPLWPSTTSSSRS